ncbi:MAG TPA: pyridoxal phosphate-dependent aminotransferase [Bryobacteraceae bacterium]|nr:pyridoxal phosphate-dependent aminotransferase [Bryobacteraceae bacterium]
MPELAPSALRVPHSRIREIAELAMTMDGVYKLYFGESNIPTPQFIKAAAAQAMADGFTFYTANAGLPTLRSALAAYYERIHNVTLDPGNRFVVTASGVQALNAAIRCMLDPGDEAILLTPAWPNATSIVMMCNATPREIPLVLQDGRFTVDFTALEQAITPRTRLLVYTSPSNPLGWVATVEEQSALLDFARRHNLWLLADEVYDRLCYTGGGPVAPSILRIADRDDAVVVAQSFSKAWCMTGWRLGWLVSRADLCARAAHFNEFTVSHAPSVSQRAGETALNTGDAFVEELLGLLRSNRDHCVQALSAMPGVTVPEPEGAFYLFPRIEGLTNSFAFCKDLLLQSKVGIAPGVAFGAGGEGSVRICYAAERQILEPALQRLAHFLSSRDKR